MRRSHIRQVWRGIAFLAAVLLIAVIIAPFAHAEAAAGATPYDWEQLATIPGAIAATLLIVQFLKLPIDTVKKIPTRAVVYVIAFVIMFAATIFKGALTAEAVGLIIVNTFIVAWAAMGAYEQTFAKLGK